MNGDYKRQQKMWALQRERMRYLRSQGWTYARIAVRYRVTPQAVQKRIKS